MMQTAKYARVSIVDGSCGYKEFCQAVGCWHKNEEKQDSRGFYGEISTDQDEEEYIAEISKKFPELILKLETDGYLYGFYQNGEELDLNKTLSMELCSGRHPIAQAVDGAIYPETVHSVTQPNKLEEIAEEALQRKPTYGDLQEISRINLYVTGLTVCLIATLNVCRKADIKVTLWHYDKYTKSYFRQEVM